MRALNPVFNRLPVRLLYLPWAAEAWRRVGVDPRRIHNGPPLVRSVLARPPAGSALRPVFGTGLPGAVEVLRTVRDPLRVLNERRARFGDISYSNMFGIKVVFPLSPGGIEEVAMNRNKAFAAGPSWGYMIGPFFRRGILLMDFDEHRYHRRILQQAFTTPHLKGYLREMQPLIRERVARFPVGDGVRMLPELKKLTLDVALEVFLGLELPQAQADRINKAFIACVDAGMSLIRRDVPGTKWSRGLAGRKVLEEFMYQHLPAKRAAAAPDLFSALCRVRSDEGHAFTDEDVVNHMIFVLMAAHDTSTITLATMAYQLARHPEWQDRARTESQSFAADLDYDALGELTVLDAVMKESLRLNAPVPGLARQAVEDTEVDGYFVPKGAHVFAVPMVNHHDPRLWTDPERFDPARFGPERAEDKSHRFAWMPFGGGVHKCIGLYFAQLEVKTIMHNLLRQFEWSVPEGYTWTLDNSTLPVPKDRLPVRLRSLS
ncbi:MAG: cytochrome P450 [Mycobacteriaceae bacterium]|nr:cytochrome P450 [Mycobacteriaceae bacterium]